MTTKSSFGENQVSVVDLSMNSALSLQIGWLLVILHLLAAPLSGHDPISTPLTWSREISRIVLRRCAGCHRPTGVAMSLTTWKDARPWAVSISEQVLSRHMPPWDAVKGFGDFAGDAGLTQEEVQTIADWVAGGSPEGDPVFSPPVPPVTPAQPRLRHPSLVVNGSLLLPADRVLAAIRPVRVAEGAEVQVTALRPDGSAEPLLWLRGFRNRFAQTFHFRRGVALPKGTRVIASPGGSFALYFAPKAGLRSQR
ncbi:MAG: hypothetical protein ABI693_28125 [Bryobacteraceae bacterium]